MARIYIFDAVGTVLRPVPDVIRAYHLAGVRHGSQFSKDQVKRRFRTARQKYFGAKPESGTTTTNPLISSDEIEYRLWKSLVSEVFADVSDRQKLFDELWAHFASPDHWQLYEDVEACWRKLAEQGDRLFVASNFDSRLYKILARFEVFALAERSFCSADVGFRKPDALFYQEVAVGIDIRDIEAVTMIGDDYQNDFLAPKGVRLECSTSGPSCWGGPFQ